MVVVALGESASCIEQLLNNRGHEGHGGVFGSVCARFQTSEASCFHVYKITNTHRLGLSIELGPGPNFMNGTMRLISSVTVYPWCIPDCRTRLGLSCVTLRKFLTLSWGVRKRPFTRPSCRTTPCDFELPMYMTIYMMLDGN